MSLFKSFPTIFSGAVVGILLWATYWYLDVIPIAVWSALGTTSAMQTARELSQELEIALVIATKALPLSLMLGLATGLLYRRLENPRVFYCSVMGWPLTYLLYMCVAIGLIESASGVLAQSLWTGWHRQLIVAVAVYGWYFLGILVGAKLSAVHQRLPQGDNPTAP